jgi:hypothetical protein
MSVHEHRCELIEVSEMKLTVMKCERLHTRASQSRACRSQPAGGTLVPHSMTFITRASRTAAFGSHLDLSVAKYAAGWNTWPHNVPEQRGEVHVQGAVSHTLLPTFTAVLSSRNQSHPRQ